MVARVMTVVYLVVFLVASYLIMAFLWAGLYALHERICPCGFVDSSKGAVHAAEGDCLY
jgi:hypothetical protein